MRVDLSWSVQWVFEDTFLIPRQNSMGYSARLLVNLLIFLNFKSNGWSGARLDNCWSWLGRYQFKNKIVLPLTLNSSVQGECQQFLIKWLNFPTKSSQIVQPEINEMKAISHLAP